MSISKMNEEIRDAYYEKMGDRGRRSPVVGCVGGAVSAGSERIRPVVRREDIRSLVMGKCVDCGITFYLQFADQLDYMKRGLELPDRCRSCRANYKVITMMGVR